MKRALLAATSWFERDRDGWGSWIAWWGPKPEGFPPATDFPWQGQGWCCPLVFQPQLSVEERSFCSVHRQGLGAPFYRVTGLVSGKTLWLQITPRSNALNILIQHCWTLLKIQHWSYTCLANDVEWYIVVLNQVWLPSNVRSTTPGGGDSHMKVTGMLVGKLELSP